LSLALKAYFDSIKQEKDKKDLVDIFLVVELEQMDLNKFLKSDQSKIFREQHVKLVLYNLLCALNFIHSANIVHRDIKPANVLINKYC